MRYCLALYSGLALYYIMRQINPDTTNNIKHITLYYQIRKVYKIILFLDIDLIYNRPG